MYRFYILLALLLGVHTADAATCTWDGSAGAWTDAARWNCGAVPGAADDVVVSAGTITLGTDVTIRALTFSGGTITGAGKLTITGPCDWSFGTMSGAGTTVAQGGTTFSTAVSKTIGRRVELASNTTWSSGTLAMTDGGVLVNRSGRLFTDNATGSHSIARIGTINTEPRVENIGTWVVTSVGTNTNVSFSNQGVLVIAGGGFDFIAPSVFTNTDIGTITGASLLNVASEPIFSNLGSTKPGLEGTNPAILPVRGDFPMGGAHDLHIELNGASTAGADYDQLAIEDGDVTVDGRLYLFVNYPAATGQTFDILTHTGVGTVSGCYEPGDIVVNPEEYEVTVTCTSSGITAEVTGTTAAEPDAVVEGFVLSSAQPNPFSDRTAFTLEVPTAQHVTAVVYDALGRRVQTLFEGTVVGGEARALTLDGAALPSGRYLVRVTGEEGTVTRQVTLQR